jgi:hypothetical protein
MTQIEWPEEVRDKSRWQRGTYVALVALALALAAFLLFRFFHRDLVSHHLQMAVVCLAVPLVVALQACDALVVRPPTLEDREAIRHALPFTTLMMLGVACLCVFGMINAEVDRQAKMQALQANEAAVYQTFCQNKVTLSEAENDICRRIFPPHMPLPPPKPAG